MQIKDLGSTLSIRLKGVQSHDTGFYFHFAAFIEEIFNFNSCSCTLSFYLLFKTLLCQVKGMIYSHKNLKINFWKNTLAKDMIKGIWILSFIMEMNLAGFLFLFCMYINKMLTNIITFMSIKIILFHTCCIHQSKSNLISRFFYYFFHVKYKVRK